MRAWRHLATRPVTRDHLPYGAVPVSGGLPQLPTRRTYPEARSTLHDPDCRRSPIDMARHRPPTSRSRDWLNLDRG